MDAAGPLPISVISGREAVNIKPEVGDDLYDCPQSLVSKVEYTLFCIPRKAFEWSKPLRGYTVLYRSRVNTENKWMDATTSIQYYSQRGLRKSTFEASCA
ncbi:hypothetical protein M413DRAFT_283619 [Hebeloma cylindrosporum]|uniref:Uncharacterized protein n=1 Tax=Hebeloma cylindrosporum TaxID=76867 RepID=A0A0C3BXH1_HEBCY|nr:hypothetical protein M413DRAFT_283619 [Hebeloma cylindrosporum h7]